jgi:hypothetical protein
MFLEFKCYISVGDNTGNSITEPVVINTDSISYFYPSAEYSDMCTIVLTNGTQFLVNESFTSVNSRFNPPLKAPSEPQVHGWIPSEVSSPDVSDDYIVSVGKDPYNSELVDVDYFKNGKWKSYGKKVQAWQPFPDQYEKT